jgi:hypothetical protein
MAGALVRAISARDRALDVFKQAQDADRVARLNAAMREAIEAGETYLKKGAALCVIFEEDPKRLRSFKVPPRRIHESGLSGRGSISIPQRRNRATRTYTWSSSSRAFRAGRSTRPTSASAYTVKGRSPLSTALRLIC